MKKLLLFSGALTLGASSFAQETTVKKVIIHDYTGLKCGWCPEGTVILENLQTNNPTNCIPIAIHTGDYEPLSSSLNAGAIGSSLTSATQVGGYPAGSVDLKKYGSSTKISMSRGQWSAAFNVQKAKTAIASVSFSDASFSGNNYQFKVNVKFNSAPTAGVPVVVNVYVIEDSIAATGSLAQSNSSGSSVQGGKSPLAPWFHNRTFRKALSGDAWGWTTVVPSNPVVNTTYSKSVTLTLDTTWVKKNVHLVAFVAYNGTASADQKEILNAEEIKLTSIWPTSVNDVQLMSVSSVYPNPAKTSDVVFVAYNIEENAVVRMRILNTLGQTVATPFVSAEVKGMHTMQWKPSEHGIAPGTYFIELSTNNGRVVQKININ